MLHHITDSRSGAGRGRASYRIVLVHGFTQTLASWEQIVPLLSEHADIVRVDLPGHGGSGHVRLDFAQTARAIAKVGGDHAVYVGYSMGGRLCLRLALDHPCRALVLLGSSPGIADPTERIARLTTDDALASSIERDGVPAFIDRWLAQPMFATLRTSDKDLEARRANSATGLASALRELGSGAQEPLWDRLGEIRTPTLLMAGAHDARYMTVAQEMAEAMGTNAATAIVPDAGHAAHLEQPDTFASLLTDFLASLPA